MPFWPFRKPVPEPLTPEELRARLIETAATGDRRRLRSLCRQYRDQIAEQIDFLRKIPEELKDDGVVDRHVQCLVAVAQCLARDCGAPALWNSLTGDPDGNPLERFDQWARSLPQRKAQLEYDTLIAESRQFVKKAETLRGGPSARQHLAIAHGRLGQLLFHSGQVADALQPFETALALCVEINDFEGQVAYLNGLIEIHRYLDDGLAAPTAERLLEVHRAHRLPDAAVEQRIKLLRSGEPLCRVICHRNGEEVELDEIRSFGQGNYKFFFRRNRPVLDRVTALTEQGNKLASSGELAAALEKYQTATDVDPYDPDPVFQSAVCLLELGAYSQAKAALEEVERLAPGWFHCRSDYWVACGLEDGSILPEQWQVLRTLEDVGLKPAQVQSLVEQAIARFPDFAPLYSVLGDVQSGQQDSARAIAAYRRGLELVEEPDLESRLTCALAAALPVGSLERRELIDRTLRLKGSLVSQATARLLRLQ